MRSLYVLSGLPGSGKSTWAEEFKKTHKEPTFIIASDEIRIELGGYPQYFEEESKVWKLFYERMNEPLVYDDANVIMDSTCLEDKFRRLAVEKAGRFDRKVLVFFNVSPSICKFRNENRHDDRKVKDYAMDEMIENFHYPSDEVISLYDSVLVISI
ncbi:MAG: ATP-binding protein [Bacilli bacterium]|nr:ATP-binding protein [Bacilli bacterium]